MDKFEGAHILKDNGAETRGTAPRAIRPSEFLASWTAPRMAGLCPRTNAHHHGVAAGTGLFLVHDRQGGLCDHRGPLIPRALTVFATTERTLSAYRRTVTVCRWTYPRPSKARAAGRKVKFIYTIVNFHNPGGSTMSVERRKRLAEISKKYNVPVFEDDPYGYVRYEGEHLPSIFSFHDEGGVLYAGSFSKILSPGTRVGWVAGPKDIIRNLTVFKQGTDLCSSPITQALVAEYCSKGYLDDHLPVIINNYRVKRDAMEKELRAAPGPPGRHMVKRGSSSTGSNSRE